MASITAMAQKLLAFIFAIAISTSIASAQSGLKITGNINGTDGKPLDGATIYLLKATDSTLVKAALSNPDGSYVLAGLKSSSYKLSVAMVGFAGYKSAMFKLTGQDVALPAIVLQPKGKSLKEVSIISVKPFVEHQIDRTVVNADALISNAGSTALDVLEKAPGVIVDQSGEISLVGKNGVKIFIDDKPTYLSGENLQNYLRSLPSSAIDQIELMTNPPAKYDAAGTGGVINIKTKRSKIRGFNGSTNFSYSQGKYGSTNNSFNFNYRDNNFNMFGNLGYSTGNSQNSLTINRQFLNAGGDVTSNFLQNDFLRRTAQNYNAKIGIDYYLSDKSTIGTVLTGLINPSNRPTINTSTFLDSKNVLDSTIVADNAANTRFTNKGINLNYRHQYTKKGQDLTVDLDYLNYQTNTDQSYNNTSYLPSGAVAGNYLLTGNLPSQLDIYSAKADYEQPLAGVRFSAGVKTSYTTTDNIANYFYTQNGSATLPDYGKTNHFLYRENINSAYVNASRDYKRFSFQLGLRLENTIANGHQLGNLQKPDSVFKQNYTSLFPTFYLQYKLDSAGKQQLSFNYGRRIERPDYDQLNPFLSPLDKFTYYTGNPFLKPSYINDFELGYTYKNITVTANYSKTIDDVNETIQILNGIYYSRPGNLGSVQYFSLNLDATFDPAKWFNFHFFTFVQNRHTQSDFYTGQLNTQGTFYYFRPILQFKTGKDWTIQADGFYQSKVTNAQFVAGEKHRVNLGLAKKISPSVSVRLAVNDVFNSFVNDGVINNLANTLADYRNKPDTRQIAVAFGYRFGKAIADQRKHNANGAESEQNRVKN